MADLTMGSLFDGSGGFPLASLMNGIRPIWASEIEPFPIRVTTKRMPFLKHYGDISQMDGAKIEPVDIITFGSPCTNLSVAGRREGLEGKQSSLFYQAIRIIKEMRCATHDQYPRYIVFENVPGAYSSASGRDFRQVLTEIVQIKDEALNVPMPENGKWMCSGEILGNDVSVAWRTLDAQFWGVAQRRRRCYLVADFAGGRAGQILFEHESLSGYTPQDFNAWKETPMAAGSGLALAGGASPAGLNGALGAVAFEPGAMRRKQSHHAWDELAGTLRADMGDNQEAVAYIKPAIPINDKATRYQGGGGSRHNDGAGNGLGIGADGDPAPTITAGDRHAVFYQKTIGTLCSTDHKWVQQQQVHQDKLIIEQETFARERSDQFVASNTASTQVARQYKDATDLVVNSQSLVVRRLMPQECAVLQGFPADWCAGLETPSPSEEEINFWVGVFHTHARINGKKPRSRKQIVKWLSDPYSDAAEYKLWGNGIALPCACAVMAGIVWADGLTA